MRSSYDYAVIRVVPRVEREEFINAGVILFCRAKRFLGARIQLDPVRLAALAPSLEAAEVEQHLALIPSICRGDPTAGEIARLTPAARFHWLTAPRSTIVQPSPVHSGICTVPPETLDELFERFVPVPLS